MKKTICFLLVMVFMMSFVAVAWADQGISDKDYAKVEQQVNQANEKIADLVEKADAKADKKPNQTDKIIAQLIDQTNKIAKKTIEFGKKYGIIVECHYVPVEIGNQIVFIDPLRIRQY
ncbi:MAG: hypothetical protein ACOX4H_00055 [Bacillota bacterium]|jgi:F0F1-type ATP synthase membrane subunit b/b'|nr:hypothetical protein [Clostridia bacterium]